MNIAEILKDAPKGTKLYSPIFGEVAFDSIIEGPYPIAVCPSKSLQILRYYMEDGRYEDYEDGECLLFPSKEQRDWSKFKIDLPINTIVVAFESAKHPEEASIRRYGGNGTYTTRSRTRFISNYIVPLNKIKEVNGELVFNRKDNYGRCTI